MRKATVLILTFSPKQAHLVTPTYQPLQNKFHPNTTCSYQGPSETAKDLRHQILRAEQHPHQSIMNHQVPRKVT